MTPEQWFVLARVTRRPPLRQVDLVEPVLGDPPNVSRLVDALVSRGHLERSPDSADRRSHLLSLTPSGQTLHDRMLRLVTGERERVFEGFDAGELDALVAALDRIDANVRRLLGDS